MRTFQVRRTGKGDLLAAGEVHEDGTVEGILAGVHFTAPSLGELKARCAELSSTGVELVFDP